jgi:hypothetical protein
MVRLAPLALFCGLFVQIEALTVDVERNSSSVYITFFSFSPCLEIKKKNAFEMGVLCFLMDFNKK